MAKWKRFFFVLALIYFGAIALSPALAKITRLQIESIAPFGSFRAGDYLRLEGRITGELASASEAIPDLEKAARNARGMIEYSGRITIIMPADPTKGNGALLVDIPNRGRPVAHFLYNSAHDRPLLLQHEIDTESDSWKIKDTLSRSRLGNSGMEQNCRRLLIPMGRSAMSKAWASQSSATQRTFSLPRQQIQ